MDSITVKSTDTTIRVSAIPAPHRYKIEISNKHVNMFLDKKFKSSEDLILFLQDIVDTDNSTKIKPLITKWWNSREY